MEAFGEQLQQCWSTAPRAALPFPRLGQRVLRRGASRDRGRARTVDARTQVRRAARRPQFQQQEARPVEVYQADRREAGQPGPALRCGGQARARSSGRDLEGRALAGCTRAVARPPEGAGRHRPARPAQRVRRDGRAGEQEDARRSGGRRRVRRPHCVRDRRDGDRLGAAAHHHHLLDREPPPQRLPPGPVRLPADCAGGLHQPLGAGRPLLHALWLRGRWAALPPDWLRRLRQRGSGLPHDRLPQPQERGRARGCAAH
mmetsp:Transcript_66425/g.160343  ORF Transcript_66425/g.160343 Transcript_66425/m.160343 type:complete len:259 (-) Transcript_66425:39-815(-)